MTELRKGVGQISETESRLDHTLTDLARKDTTKEDLFIGEQRVGVELETLENKLLLMLALEFSTALSEGENIVMFDQMEAALRDNRERGGMNDPLLKIIRSLGKKEGIDDKKIAQAEELAINLKRCASDLKIVSGLLKKKEQEGK